MKRVCMYQAVDGALFNDEAMCAAHNQDCIGQEFDALLLAALQGDTRGNVTRNDQHRMCLHLLKNKAAVLPTLQRLVEYIESDLNPDIDED